MTMLSTYISNVDSVFDVLILIESEIICCELRLSYLNIYILIITNIKSSFLSDKDNII